MYCYGDEPNTCAVEVICGFASLVPVVMAEYADSRRHCTLGMPISANSLAGEAGQGNLETSMGTKHVEATWAHVCAAFQLFLWSHGVVGSLVFKGGCWGRVDHTQ